MAQHRETPGAGAPRASEIVAWKADSSLDTAPSQNHQARKLAQRFGISAEVAALVVELAFAQPENSRGRA